MTNYLFSSLLSMCCSFGCVYDFLRVHLMVAKPGIDVKKSVVVTLSSDKGLCGGINSTVVKVSRALYKLNAGMF